MEQQARRLSRLAAVIVLLAAAACGSPPASPATPQSVALRASDLPKGLTTCSSGDVQQFLKTAPSGNSLGIDLQQQWSTLQQQGAQSGYARVFAGSKDQCNAPLSSQALTGVTWVAGLAIEFKTAAAASKGYAGIESGLAELTLAPGTEQGAATGFGANSLSFGDTGGGQSVYFATWQHSHFLVYMLSVGVPEQKARQAARDVDSRIH